MSKALIVGGGPAGAAAAITLARAGLPHLLVERSRETGDALCGGFLSWRTHGLLAGLGVDADSLNPRRVTTARLFAGKRRAEARLPGPAIGVSRRRLDSLLLERAVAEGACVERGVAVRAINDGVARLSDGGELDCEALFLATGKHDLRGHGRPVQAADPALGLRVRLPASPALTAMVGQSIELHLFERGYAGLVLQEDGSANLCMAVSRSRLTEAGDPALLLARLGEENPALGDRMAHAVLSRTRIDAVANVPYGWRQRSGTAGLFRLGDQAAVIPSLAGEGMAIALASGLSAAHAYSGGGAAASARWQSTFAHGLTMPMAAAGLLRATAGRKAGATALAAIASLFPGALGLAARLTRI